jgi:hypothetical protein
MAPESKMDAEICFQHRVYRISSFSTRFFTFFLILLLQYFCRKRKLNIVAGIQNGGLHVIYLLKTHVSKLQLSVVLVHS